MYYDKKDLDHGLWPEWVQASDTLSAVGAVGAHACLNRQVGDNWIVGTHFSQGLEGLVEGYH